MDKLEPLKKKVKKYYSKNDPAHDFSHVIRVYKNANIIGKKEKADLSILLPAALLHDIISLPKDHKKQHLSGDLAAAEAKKLLKEIKYPEGKIPKIIYCISSHDFYKGVVPNTKEASILQDADRLDAIGAIGIARCFSVCGQIRRKLYSEQDPFCKKRRPDDKKACVDHFYRKLLKLERGMHTVAARKMVRERHAFMLRFLKQLEKEI